METILLPKIKYYKIQREVKKMDTQIQTKQYKDKLYQGSPQEHPEKRNSASCQ
jgi:hypothetical protein